MLKNRLLSLVVLPALIVGCGGGHSSNSGGGSAGTGSGAVTFSDGEGYNGSSSKISTFTTVQGAASDAIISAQGSLVKISGRSADTRLVTFSLVGANPEGTVITLDDGQTPNTVVYSETFGADNSATRSWVSTGGTVTIQSRTATKLVLKMDGVRVAHGSDNDTVSTGAVTLDGTLSVDLSSQL